MALCNAGVTMIKYIADPNDVIQQTRILAWAGKSDQNNNKVFPLDYHPDADRSADHFSASLAHESLTLDEEEARKSGNQYTHLPAYFIGASTLLSAAAVCLGGLIGWVGLMIPHMARAFVGAYERLIPAERTSRRRIFDLNG